MQAEHDISCNGYQQSRLHSAPRAVPVLQVDRESDSRKAAHFGEALHRHRTDAANHQYDMHDFL